MLVVQRYLFRAFALALGVGGTLVVLGGVAGAQSFTPPDPPQWGQNLQGVIEQLRSSERPVADIAKTIREQLPAPPVTPPVGLPPVGLPDIPDQAAPTAVVAPAQTQGGNVSDGDTAASGPAISGNLGLFIGPIGIGTGGLSLGGQESFVSSGAAAAGSQIFGPAGTSPFGGSSRLGSLFGFGTGGFSPFGSALAPTQFGGFGGLFGGGTQQQQNTSNGATATSGPAVAFNAGLFLSRGGLLGGLGGGASQVAVGASGPAYAGSQVTTGFGGFGFGGFGSPI